MLYLRNTGISKHRTAKDREPASELRNKLSELNKRTQTNITIVCNHLNNVMHDALFVNNVTGLIMLLLNDEISIDITLC